MRTKFTAGPFMKEVIKAIPVYPDAASPEDLKAILGCSDKGNVNRALFSLPSNIPICEDGKDLCYTSEEGKKSVLKAYGII